MSTTVNAAVKKKTKIPYPLFQRLEVKKCLWHFDSVSGENDMDTI